MAYTKTNWQDFPSTNTPLNTSNLNKIENELEKLDPSTPYTQANGTYTTAAWAAGTNTCTWTAPRTGLYLIFARFTNESDSQAKVYKQFQLKGTATRITGDVFFYQNGTSSSSSSDSANAAVKGFQGCVLVSATQGQTIIPYVHTPQAEIEWTVNLTGLFLK